MMISKTEQLPASFLFSLRRLSQAFVTQRWKQLESHISSIIIGFVSAYIVLELFPSIHYGYATFGIRLYWLLLVISSLYLGLKQILPKHFSGSILHATVQNAQLRKANHQLRQNLQEQEILEQSLKKENQKLHRLATVDELTQIQNRRFFDQQFQYEWQQLQQTSQPLSVILFDVDYFKRYNDFYGHLAGDHCLQEIARVVRKSLRGDADFVARYGGEEFAVVLPNTNELGAVAIAQTIQQAIQSLGIPHAQSDISSIVSVSLGIASIVPIPESSWKMLVDQADQALYEAKRQGRDRYILKRYFTGFSSSVIGPWHY